jgi:hypothetical protein
MHPINLVVRFALELAIVAAYGYWGWTQHDDVFGVMLATGVPLLAAILWGTFRVPDDPGPALVAVPGPLRLALELILFAGAVLALALADRPMWAWALGIVVLLHYIVSYDRVVWLLRQ